MRWPDEGLRAVVGEFRWPLVTRVEQRFHSERGLLVELIDADAPEPARPTVRLSWDAFHARILALEVDDEFYSGPYAQTYAWKTGTEQRFLHEIVNDLSPWIEELPDDTPAVGVVPPSGAPVAAREDTLAQNPSWHTPSGRFYRPGTPMIGEGIDVIVSFGAEASGTRVQWEAQKRASPRSRPCSLPRPPAWSRCRGEVMAPT
ncbi:hypothetical protein [Deinococcus koreensis]|uniref:Uncharacterized protein n=1 Tax=Deinococcus koreensis TaxID=2054903 RepID=A0A2K3UVF6_9DEIO|nr:hypothetical protein [Deinococcus koreensis]PNY80516.1 hypothetical protein CVO96_03290 [Deinococcus koreensis]